VSADIMPEGTQVTWAGTQDGLVEISGRGQDLRGAAQSGDSLNFRYRIDAPSDQTVRLALFCTDARCGAALDLTPALRAAQTGDGWHTLSVPLSCFTAAGADLSAVEMPFAIGTAGHLKLTISDVRLEPAGGSTARACPRPT
jgi:beta-glucosidase